MVLRLFPLISPIIFSVVVTFLGFITPGYSHLNYTISRLAIEKYGWIQSLNFIQLAIGIYLTGTWLTNLIRDGNSVQVIKVTFWICSAFSAIAAFVPTDPIENVPLDFTLLSPHGLVHISLVIIFLTLSPFGITELGRVLGKHPQFSHLRVYTLLAGFFALVGSIIWFVFYFSGIYLEYRGIFQKVIALPVLIWLVLINFAMLKKHPGKLKL